MALPKQHRLKGRHEFSKIFAGTRPAVSDSFSLRISRDSVGAKATFAVVVPVKLVAHATARNALRRRTSEAVARIIRTGAVIPGVSAVILVRTKCLPETVVLERELLSLMKKSGILN